ncbi:MAG: hypothetical protein ACOC7X_07900 [Spirochaetota bacterium]
MKIMCEVSRIAAILLWLLCSAACDGGVPGPVLGDQAGIDQIGSDQSGVFRFGGPGSPELEEVLAVPDPAQRYKRLLGLYLSEKKILPLGVHLSQAELELGRPEEAEIWLAEARKAFQSGRGEPSAKAIGDACLIWELATRAAWLRQRYRECIRFAAKAGEYSDALRSAGADERLARVQLLAARSRLAGGIDPLRGCQTIYELAKNHPKLLVIEDVLRAVEIYDGDEEDHAAAHEHAQALLQHYWSSCAYSPGHAEAAVEFSRRCGMDAARRIGQLELHTFTLKKKVPNADEQLVKISRIGEELCAVLKHIEAGLWREAEAAMRTLERDQEVPPHRFVSYLHALVRLYRNPGSEAVRREYARQARHYGREQRYFVHLFRALADTAGTEGAYAARELYGQALQGCIAAGPYTAAADEARMRLAEQAGIPPELQARPLLPAEMKQIAALVQEGGPPQLLQPLTAALEWPENRFTLQAGLLLRQLRGQPAVREYLSAEFQLCEGRARERLRAILQL